MTVLLILLIIAAYGVQTASGFGAGLILVTFGMYLLDLPVLLALLMPLSILQTGWITARHRSSIVRPLLFGRILPIMGVGMGLGYLLAVQGGSRPELKQLLGGLVSLFALRELWQLHHGAPPGSGGRWTSLLSIFSAGIVHGLYGTGGPLLVYGLGREGLDRARFRATITAVWFILNLVLIGSFAIEGRYTPAMLQQIPVLALGVPIGVLLGERAFSRMDEATFKRGVYILLALAGLPLLWG